MVLGLSYIFFFNSAANPLNLYWTMAILFICTITHFYTVSHLTALTALKAMDREFEAVSASLKRPTTRTFRKVTVPVCLPTGLDIAVDHGSLAPMGVFVKAFAEFGVAISIDEARGPMGMAKRDHVSALMHALRIAAAWAGRHGATSGEPDIDRVYEVFVPLNAAVVTEFADLIVGAADVVRDLRARGLKIGSDDRLHSRDHGPPAAGRRRPGLRARQLRLHRRHPGRAALADYMYRSFLDLGVWPGLERRSAQEGRPEMAFTPLRGGARTAPHRGGIHARRDRTPGRRDREVTGAPAPAARLGDRRAPARGT